MALIGTIRNNFWFVLILLGLALVAFIFMDISGANSQAGAVQTLTMGEINGKKIDYKAFQQTESAYYSGNTSDAFAKKKTIWDFYVEEALLDDEVGDLGITVPTEELMELQFGSDLSPIVTQNWMNQQTRQVDRAQLNSFRTAIEENEEMNPKFRAYWAEQERHIIKQRKEEKLTAMVTKGMYTPNWLAEAIYKEDNTTVTFDLVKVPFDMMTQDVEVTNADITNYLEDNRATYFKEEESRVIEYTAFDVVPTSQDSTDIFTNMNEIATNFKTAENDSLFALSNNGGYANYYFGIDQLPEVAKERISTTMNPGDVIGPYLDKGNYSILKLLDKQSVPDSVEARHILIKCDRNNSADLAAAKARIDSVKTVLRGGANFADVAKSTSDDGSASQGGDLGTFVQGTMVAEFNEACFYKGKVNGYQTVVTQFGVHLIDVQNRIFGDNSTKYKIASIVKPIVPSENTQNTVYSQVADYVSENREINALKGVLGSNSTFEVTAPLAANDYTITALGQGDTSRDIIKWAYDGSTEIGDVSPEIYTFTDKVNYFDNKYVVASLKSIEEPGMMSADAARSSVESAVRNQLKAKAYAATVNATDLNAFASEKGLEVQSIENANTKVGFLAGVGQEPEVVAAAMSTPANSVSQPIVGNSGVFIVKPTAKNEASGNVNLSLIRQSQKQAATSQASFKILNALKKGADIEDGRSKFF
jgi:peptidyl-prolyl cis-trans isomerase D